MTGARAARCWFVGLSVGAVRVGRAQYWKGEGLSLGSGVSVVRGYFRVRPARRELVGHPGDRVVVLVWFEVVEGHIVIVAMVGTLAVDVVACMLLEVVGSGMPYYVSWVIALHIGSGSTVADCTLTFCMNLQVSTGSRALEYMNPEDSVAVMGVEVGSHILKCCFFVVGEAGHLVVEELVVVHVDLGLVMAGGEDRFLAGMAQMNRTSH